jgi:thiol-disulfide isomerase/thioredoxin
MIITHIDSRQGDVQQLNQYVKQGKPVFVLFYMEGCGPCNATRPEWKKLENVLKDKYQNKDIVIADVDQELLKKMPDLSFQPAGFPSMVYIKGPEVEEYENSSIDLKDRSIDSFVEWIETKVPSQKGGKWSLKYKKSINCRKPKGFSQRQHCKYGRKKGSKKGSKKGGKRSRKYRKK